MPKTKKMFGGTKPPKVKLAKPPKAPKQKSTVPGKTKAKKIPKWMKPPVTNMPEAENSGPIPTNALMGKSVMSKMKK